MAQCHAPPTFTAEGRYDVGLDDAVGNRRFNPPLLQGVGLREPYLHDGRAATLEDVFLNIVTRATRSGRPGGARMAAYLRTL